jgi:hypothetical protein
MKGWSRDPNKPVTNSNMIDITSKVSGKTSAKTAAKTSKPTPPNVPGKIFGSDKLYKLDRQVIKLSRDENLKLTEEFTIMLWVKQKERSKHFIRVFGKGSMHVRNYGIWLWPGSGKIQGSARGIRIYGKKEMPLNTWTHIAYSYKVNDKSKIFINGKFVSERKVGGRRLPTHESNHKEWGNNTELMLGGGIPTRLNNKGDSRLSGEAKSPYLFNRALSDDEIMKLAKYSAPTQDEAASKTVSKTVFKKYPNIDAGGNDIGYHRVNPKACEKIALNNKKAVGFVTDRNGTRCWIKSRFSRRVRRTQRVLYEKTKEDAGTPGKLTYSPQEKKLVIRLPDRRDGIHNSGLSWAIKSTSVTKIEVSGFKAIIEKKNFNLNGQLGFRDRKYKYYNIKGEWNGPYNWMIRAGGRMFSENTTKNPLIVTLYNIKPGDEIVSLDMEAQRKHNKTNYAISYKQPLETIGFSKFDRNVGTWNPVLRWGIKVRAQRLKIPDLPIYKPPASKHQLIGVGRLNSLTKVSLPSGVTYVENKLYDKYGKEIFNPPKVALSITPKNISIVKASLKDKPKYISYRKQFYHVASLCCIILNWKDDDENLKECQRMAASMDIGYLNDLIKRAFEQSDKHAMKDGKSANYLTRKRLDEALNVLVDKSREIIAIDNRECGCTEFELGSPLCIPC